MQSAMVRKANKLIKIPVPNSHWICKMCIYMNEINTDRSVVTVAVTENLPSGHGYLLSLRYAPSSNLNFSPKFLECLLVTVHHALLFNSAISPLFDIVK